MAARCPDSGQWCGCEVFNSEVYRLSYIHSRPWPVGVDGDAALQGVSKQSKGRFTRSTASTVRHPQKVKQQSSRRLPAPGGHSRRPRLPRAGYTYMYPISAVVQSPPPPWLATGQWIRHLSEKCTNTSDLRPECEKRSRGRKTACRRAPTAVYPLIGLSNGPGHRQHAWYARTARLKSVITSNLDRSTQKWPRIGT